MRTPQEAEAAILRNRHGGAYSRAIPTETSMTVAITSAPLARSTDPVTSHEAAEGIARSTTCLQAIVLKCLRDFGPQTTHEIAERTQLTVVTVSPRIKPLRSLGMVRASGERREKRSVWEAV